MPVPIRDIARSWRLLLLEEEAVRNYWRSYLMYGLQSHPDALMDQLMPSLIYIKALTIVDDALDALITSRALVMPRKYLDSLGGRIDFLAGAGVLTTPDEFHRMRLRRNELRA